MIQIDIKMPKTCYDCPLDFEHFQCNATGESYYLRKGKYVDPETERMPDCPIAAIPPHGRLIDADAFLALVNDTTILSGVLKYIINALIMGEPTVVEAEDGKP